MSHVNPPENTLPYLLRGAFRGFETALGRHLKPYDLPLSQFYILRLQWRREGNSQSDIATRAFMSESVASQVIQKMERRGLVRRKPSPQDYRKQIVTLTNTGKKLRDKLTEDDLKISTEDTPNISREDMKTTIEVMQKIRSGFDLYNAK